MISRNPQLWQFRTVAYDSYFDRDVSSEVGNTIRIFDNRDSLVTTFEVGDDRPRPPFIVRSRPLFDAGSIVGRVEIRQSLRPLAFRTAAVALAAIGLGGVLLAAFWTFPLRALRKAWARVTFLAAHDALTALPNRVLLGDRLEQAIGRVQRGDEQSCGPLSGS